MTGSDTAAIADPGARVDADGGGPVLKVAAAQLGPASERLADNLQRVVATIEQAAQASVDWLCLPELALTPYFCHSGPAPDEWFLPAGSSVLAEVGAAVRSAGLVTLLPFAEADGHRRYNSAALFDRDGRVRGIYRKVHLPDAEQRFFDGGERLEVWDLEGVGVGTIVCADRSFVESWRVLGVKGARVVLTPYGTTAHGSHRGRLGCPEGTDRAAWMREFMETRVRGSASLNGFFVVGAGKAGVERGIPYLGDSMVVSPWGNVLARAETDGDELVVADIDVSVAEGYRATGYYDRRARAVYADTLGA